MNQSHPISQLIRVWSVGQVLGRKHYEAKRRNFWRKIKTAQDSLKYFDIQQFHGIISKGYLWHANNIRAFVPEKNWKHCSLEIHLLRRVSKNGVKTSLLKTHIPSFSESIFM